MAFPRYPSLRSILGIQVKTFVQAGVHVTTARVSCCKDGCGKEIELVSDSRDTEQHVQCPKHGELAVFKNFADYTEALKFAINEKSDATGLPQIDASAEGKFEQDN
jgi:hypothetical protein